MTTNSKLLFLGTGSSMGIPVIGCRCPVCLSDSPFNHRLRPSALCTIKDKKILIDCGPDFRMQALKYGIDHLDGVIFTHAHNDHTIGVDDLKVYCLRDKQPIPCLLSVETANEMRQRFAYLFHQQDIYAGAMTRFNEHLIEDEQGEAVFQGIKIRYFTYEQGSMHVNGFRFGDMAYVSDIRDYQSSIFSELAGVKTLILSALRMMSSKIHFGLDEAIDFARQVGAQKTWLMHVAHELDHSKGDAYLPDNIRLAYDGLQIDFQAVIVD